MTQRAKQIIGKVFSLGAGGLSAALVFLGNVQDTLTAVIAAVSAVAAAFANSPLEKKKEED